MFLEYALFFKGGSLGLKCLNRLDPVLNSDSIETAVKQDTLVTYKLYSKYIEIKTIKSRG